MTNIPHIEGKTAAMRALEDDLRMGFDDLSPDEHATMLLKTLSPEELQVLHRFALNGPYSVLEHIGQLRSLIAGLDDRDPNRKSAFARDLTTEEIATVGKFFNILASSKELPVLGRSRRADEPEDMARQGWGVIEVVSEWDDVRTYRGLLATMGSYVENPATHREVYDEQMLAFLNDVIFRPDVTFERG